MMSKWFVQNVTDLILSKPGISKFAIASTLRYAEGSVALAMWEIRNTSLDTIGSVLIWEDYGTHVGYLFVPFDDKRALKWSKGQLRTSQTHFKTGARTLAPLTRSVGGRQLIRLNKDVIRIVEDMEELNLR